MQTDINDSLFSDQMDTGTRSGSCTSTGMKASILALAVTLALALCQEVRVRNYEYINLFKFFAPPWLCSSDGRAIDL